MVTRENGQGMMFRDSSQDEVPPPRREITESLLDKPQGKPTLKIVK
jgi:stringent starvation protein B